MPRKKQAIHASGLVEVKATIGKDIHGKRIQKSFYGASKLEAKKKADDYILQQEIANKTGEVFIKKEYTFSEWASKWLEVKKGTVKEYTYETTYKSKIDKYLIPYFGKSGLRSIKQIDIQGFFTKHSHLSKSMQDKFRIILFSVFDLAIDNDLCSKNPVKNIKISNTEQGKKRVYSQHDTDLLIGYCISNSIIDVLLLIETGIRRSELLGLQWNDVDFERKILRINSAVTPNKGKSVEAKTKSESSMRDIPIDDMTANTLKKHCRNGYILKGQYDSYMSPSGYAKHFRATMSDICENLEIEMLNPHELRHTFGTLLHERGVDIYTIQKLMGHADISITAKTYIHNDIEAMRKAMKI